MQGLFKILNRSPATPEASRRRERLRRAKASARRRSWRKVCGFAALVLVVTGLLLALAILGRLSETSTTLKITHHG